MKPLSEFIEEIEDRMGNKMIILPVGNVREALKRIIEDLPEDNSEMVEEYQIGFNEAIRKFKNKLEKHFGKELLEDEQE